MTRLDSSLEKGSWTDSLSFGKLEGREVGNVTGKKLVSGDDGIKVRGRKKGDLVPRKIFYKGKLLEILINERPMQNVMVERIVTEWRKLGNPHRNIGHWRPEYMRAVAYLPDNYEMKLHIVDANEIRFITSVGSNYLCLVKMPVPMVKRLIRSDAWFKEEEMTVYRIEPSIDLKEFFRFHDWKRMLDLYLTEGLDKDWRLVEAFKTIVLPLIPLNWKNDSELSKLQYFNNHMFLVTNTKVGKSEWAKILGEMPSSEWSSAGFFGSFEKGERIEGKLEGAGTVFIDEAMYITGYSEIAILPALLTYAQQGTACRTIKGNVEARGTKTLVFASNPTRSEDLLASFEEFLKVLCGKDYPEKVGGRCGLVLLGNDYKTVRPQGDISEYRGVVLRLIKQVVQKFYYSRIYPILKTNMKWACDTKEAENTYKAFSLCCPSVFIKKFIDGMSLSIPKIKMGVIRSLILEHLPELVLSFNLKKFQREIIEKEREERFQMLVSINFKSFQAMTVDSGLMKNKKLCISEIKKRFPEMSLRDIGLFLGESKSNIERWLKEDEKGDSPDSGDNKKDD